MDSRPGTTLTRFFAPEDTTPVDRRRVLGLFAAAGAVCAGGTTVWNTAQPKQTSEVNAPSFAPAPDTDTALQTLRHDFGIMASSAGRVESNHAHLFQRTVSVAWKKDHEEDYTECKEVNGKEICKPKKRTVTTHHNRTETITIDQDMASLDLPYLHKTAGAYRALVAALQKLTDGGLLEITGTTGDAVLESSSTDFAEHFGFAWKTGDVSPLAQTALATGLGLVGSALLLWYKEAADFVTGRVGSMRSRYGGHQSHWRDYAEHVEDAAAEANKREEMQRTRRAFFRMVGGGVAAGLAFKTAHAYAERSAALRATGEQQIRDSVLEGNRRDQTHFFGYYFRTAPRSLLDDLGHLIDRLRRVTIAEVDRSVRRGIRRVEELEAQLYRQMPMGAYGEHTTQKDDQFEAGQIVQYVRECHTLADTLEAAQHQLQDFFADGVPAALLPAMRARFVTDGIDAAVSEQHSTHMWGLAGDLGILYGSALAIALASEYQGSGHHAWVYDRVQGICDWIDRRKMSVYEIVTNLRGKYSQREIATITQSGAITALAETLKQELTDGAEDYETMGVVQDLRRQLRALDAERIVQVYIDKALVFYARKQLGAQGLKTAFTAKHDPGDPVVTPPIAELRAQVERYMQSVGSYALFDLIEADAIEDHEPEEDWMTAEPQELSRTITYWAERIAGLFGSVKQMYVAAHILPDAWWENDSAHTVTAAEVEQAFVQAVEAELAADPDTAATVRTEIERTLAARSGSGFEAVDRPVSDEEITQRFLLRRMFEAHSNNSGIEVLFAHHPALAEAVTTP